MAPLIRKTVFIFLVFTGCFVTSQTVNDKVKLVFEHREHTPDFSSDRRTGRPTTIVIYFSVGESPKKKIGWRGKNIAGLLKKDPAAYHEFLAYRKTLNKKIGFKIIKGVSTLISIVGAITLIGSSVSDKKNPAVIIIGAGAAIAGVAGAIFCSVKEFQLYNKAIECLEKSVNIYNENLEKKTGLDLKD